MMLLNVLCIVLLAVWSLFSMLLVGGWAALSLARHAPTPVAARAGSAAHETLSG